MIVELAPAKINLALHVRRRRADGYHDIETVFAFCRDGDSVTITRAAADSFRVIGPFAPALESEGDNLVTRAARAFVETFAPGVCHGITLDKHLPVASGIGGGSADAAATLRALARLHDVAIHDPRLVDIASALGADVPACLAGVSALGRGRGDALTPVAGLADTPLLLVNSGVAVSTAAVFKAWDRRDRGALGWAGDPMTAAIAARNDLELPARAVAPTIDSVLDLLSASPGIRLARMSGSGATCFGLFDDARQVSAAAARARAKGWWCLETRLA